jgi:retron-type reverse transcriptase
MNNRSLDSLGGDNLLFHKIISIENLFCAWHEFKRGKNKCPDVQAFAFSLEDDLFTLHEQLLQNKWQPDPYIGFYIKDPKLRHIHKASVRDRIFYQAVFRVLDPIWEPRFIANSFSSRVGKGTLAGVNAVESFARKSSKNWTRKTYALSCDIRRFFDTIDHVILERMIAKVITEDLLLALIGKIIKSFECSEGKGLPLGNVTSQSFANIYLNELDQFMKRNLHAPYYARYCDDFVIVSHDSKFLKSLISDISEFLQKELLMELHPNKIELKTFRQGVDFLGYIIRPHHRVFRTSTKRRMLKKLCTANELVAEDNMEEETLTAMLHSYQGMLSHCRSYRLQQLLVNIYQHKV